MSSTNSKIPVRKNLIPTSYTAAMVGHPNAGKVRMGWVKTNPATASTIKKISAASTNLTKIPIRTKKVAGTSVNTVKESLKADKPSTSKAVELTTPRHGKSADAVVEKTTPCNKTIPSPFIETAPNFNVKDKKSPLQRIVTFYDGMPVVTDYFRLGPLYHEEREQIADDRISKRTQLFRTRADIAADRFLPTAEQRRATASSKMSSTEITIRKYAAGLNDTATAVMDDCREEINLYKQATKDVDEKGGEMAVRNKDGDKYMNKESAKMIIDKLESQAKMALRMKRTVEALPKDGVVEDENEKIKNMFIEGMTRMGVYARPK